MNEHSKRDINHVELSAWDTPISGSELEVLSVKFDREAQPEPDFEKHVKPMSSPIMTIYQTELIVRVKDLQTEEIFQFHFDNVGAFRVLDEHGLQELYGETVIAPDGLKLSTCKARHHGWSDESPISFFFGTKEGWSYFILTGWDCVEILAKDDPFIFLELKSQNTTLN